MACSILAITNGAIAVFSTLVYHSGAGTVMIENDSAGSHVVTIGPITELVDPVQGIDLAAPLALSPTISGANNGAIFVGGDSKSVTLANAGVDIISVEVDGNIDGIARAGLYQASLPISCI